jgi:DNA repair protein RecO (recombination protein O)
MFTHYRSRAFVLKKEDRGEADRLFTVFSEDFGRLEILGKAVRKISSKLRPSIDVFYLYEIEFIQGKSQKTLTDAVLIRDFADLKTDLKRLAVANLIAEAGCSLIIGQERDVKIWHLLAEVFDKLNDLDFRIHDPKLIYFYFLWNLIETLGYVPDLERCFSCSKEIEPAEIHFIPLEGLVCQTCSKSVKSIKETDSETIKILRIILKKEWSLLSKLKMEKSNLDSLDRISRVWFSSIIDIFS